MTFDATARQDDTPHVATHDATEGEIVTITEAADRLGVSIRTVQRRLDSGELISIEHEGKRQVFFPDDATPDTPRRHDTTTAEATDDAPPVEPGTFKATPDDVTIELIEQLRGERDRLIEQLEDTRAERDKWQNFAGVMLERMKALPSPVAPDDVKPQEAAQAVVSTPTEEIPAKSTPVAPRAAQGRNLMPWQQVIARVFGIR